jgi:arabinan endo-1,5-alpha-L-arabinosidase
MIKPHQQWSVEPVAGGYMGAPYYKILIAGTTRALAATADGKLVADAAFSGTTGQLWRIDQLTDGSYRITPRLQPTSGGEVALVAAGASTPVLARFDPASAAGRWTFQKP